jgi:hypothetical protein
VKLKFLSPRKFSQRHTCGPKYITPYRRRFEEACCMHVPGIAVKVHFNETSMATICGGLTSPNLRQPPSGKGRKHSIFQKRAKSASILPTDAFSKRDFKLPSQCSSDQGFFWDTTLRIVAIRYRRCGTTYRPHLQASKNSFLLRIIDPFFSDFLTPEGETDRLSRNDGKVLPLHTKSHPRKAPDLEHSLHLRCNQFVLGNKIGSLERCACSTLWTVATAKNIAL